MSMFKQCLERKEAKEDHIRHGKSLSRIILIHHGMPKSPWSIFIRPKGSHGNMIKSLIQVVTGATKEKRPRCIIRFQCPSESYSQYWSKIMGFSSFLQGLEDPHIQKDTMSMPYVNTMEELEDIPWRIAQLSKTRFDPWSTQIRSNSENLLVVIRSTNIKDQLEAVFVCLLIMNVFIRAYAFWEM